MPFCLVRKLPRKTRYSAKLAGDQWSPLHTQQTKNVIFATPKRLPQCGSLLLYPYQNFPPELPPKPSLSVLDPLELLSSLTGSYLSVSVVWV